VVEKPGKPESFEMIAKTFFGLEEVLADELLFLGAQDVELGRRMVSFRGDERLMVRANVYCRTAVRVLKPIATFTAADEQELYQGIGRIDWLKHLEPEATLAIDPVVHSPIFSNSLYSAQLAKDAIVDQIRAATGQRPNVDLADPDLRINLHIDRDRVTVYLDSSGDSLHKRGYRVATGEAPMNEVLAAGILRLSRWDENSPLVDFMCGSGTLVIEAALMARRIAPGLVRQKFGYLRWKGFDRAVHEAVMAEAKKRVLPRVAFAIRGSDLDPRVIAAARENVERAGLSRDVTLAVENFEHAAPPAPAGTIVINPPYDERMKTAQIDAVYRRIGDVLKQRWPGYTAFIFTGNLDAAKHIGLRTSAKTRLFNGPIECRLLKFELVKSESTVVAPPRSDRRDQEQIADFRNRLSRMAKHWHRWARRQGITCYRIYDRDIPDVPLAVDWYDGNLVVSEHDRPHSRTEIEQLAWLEQMVGVIAQTLEVPAASIVLKARTRPVVTGRPKKPEPPRIVEVQEGELRFEVHLDGGKETGLELDQRILRTMVRAEAADKRVLNLFAHCGTLTVAAVAGGASSTLSVEAARGRVDWTRKNFQLNDISSAQHRLLCQDPLLFAHYLDPTSGAQFDLAVVQPPGFDGKRRPEVWNVQDGHVELLNSVLQCMSIGGKLFFITPFRRLTLHAEQIVGATVREITRQTVPPDFRNKKVHRAWILIRTAEESAEEQPSD